MLAKLWCGRPLAAAFLMLAMSGCANSKGPFPVEGTVVWADGQPATELAGAQVVFESAEHKTSARGVVKPDGTFKVTTVKPDDGALPGEHVVAVLEQRLYSAGEGSPLAPGKMDAKYARVESSGLTATVKPGVNKIELKVTRTKK